jgi:hypothetical protein
VDPAVDPGVGALPDQIVLLVVLHG